MVGIIGLRPTSDKFTYLWEAIFKMADTAGYLNIVSLDWAHIKTWV